MIVSNLPIWAVDIIGSISLIVLSFLCWRLAMQLRRRDPNNIIWIYLFWVCTALALFAVSRSLGHILKQLLIIWGLKDTWDAIRPFSGAVNTFAFVVVGSFTLFFQRSWNTYQEVLNDKLDLQNMRDELLYVNQNLEKLVAERTQELAVSEQKYRRIFEVSRDMILVARDDGRIKDINPAGREMIGLNSRECAQTKKMFQDFFAEADEWRSVIDTIRRRGFAGNAEIQLLADDGRKIRVLLSGALDRSERGGNGTVHFLAKDIEEKRTAEEQIAQADKLASIGQLSAGIAHEINNPLGIILGYTQLLIRHEPEESEKFKDLKTIEKHVRNCKTIVEDLLNFARTSRPQESLIRIDHAMDDVLKFVQQHAGFERIEIRRHYDPGIPEMLLDEKKIKQVFMNLIMNAGHAMDGEGRLEITTHSQPERSRVVINITDSGHGIQSKDLTRIFDPFFTTKPTGEGTGLGLSVSYGIIKNHGGDISVESVLGEGATFTISLPVITPDKDDTNV